MPFGLTSELDLHAASLAGFDAFVIGDDETEHLEEGFT